MSRKLTHETKQLVFRHEGRQREHSTEREKGGDPVRGWRKDGEAKGKERDHDKGEALLATLALASSANTSVMNSSRFEVVVFNQSQDEVYNLNYTRFLYILVSIPFRFFCIFLIFLTLICCCRHT